MRRIFTEYVRDLDPAGQGPEEKAFAELWGELERALKSELKKRGLWHAPPSFLGVVGWKSWLAPADGGDRRGALDELLADCYGFVFVVRLRSLKEHLKVKPNIDGLVFLSIRSFLLERQKEHDPLGFRIFQLLRSAMREALAAGELHLLAGDPKISNDSVLGRGPGPPAAAAELEVVARRWNDRFLTDLVTARGKGRPGIVGKLRRALRTLGEDGIRAFRFKDLVDPLKSDARNRWAAIAAGDERREVPWQSGESDLAGALRAVTPELKIEDRDSFRKLVDCVSKRLERSEAPPRTRRQLRALWECLWTAADGRTATSADAEALPSRRKIAARLRIPRQRLPELYATLGKLVRDCREADSGHRPLMKSGGLPRSWSEKGE